MNALAQSASSATPFAVPLLRTLVLSDLVDSTALVGRLGDQRAADLFRKHDRVVRALLQEHGGREIDKTDGFLTMFERPIQAVAFALDYQRQLKQLGEDEGCALTARVGIHVGDVLTWDNSPDDIAKGAKATEVEGLVKPIVSRLAQLALPGQTLLSGVAYSLAHRAQGELGDRLALVRWRSHGRYQFKGVPDPIPVFEIGEEGHAPLKPPPWSGKAHREIPFWRRPASLAVELVLLFAVIAVPAWYLFKPAPAIAFANRDWVVVGDLKNLTGESKFDESLQTAFRIGLEQSRHVNVLSDLKTRETIKLMQRDPEKTAVDRTVGSEIAIRDGARALILPTIAEIGGRVRVTAEVVDPNTQTTVYSESADGVGEQSVLPSLDKVNQQLRVRLGEALATVSNESRPLEKAATKNLDALRAYSLAQRAYNSNKQKEALALVQQATKLDPGFALARTLTAAIHINAGDNVSAKHEIDQAVGLRDRLSARDSLYVEAWKTSLEAPGLALGKWKALAQLYPDFQVARGLYGYNSYMFANRYDEAIRSYQSLDSPQSPFSGSREATMAIFYLGQENFEQARERIRKARNLGFVFTQLDAEIEAAQRNLDKAETLLKEGQPSTVSKTDIGALNFSVTLQVDRGSWDDVWTLLKNESSALAADQKMARAKLNVIEASLRATTSVEGKDRDLAKGILSQLPPGGGDRNSANRYDSIFHQLFASYLSASTGDVKAAEAGMADAGAEVSEEKYPVLNRMRVAAQAEILRVKGTPEESIRLLQQHGLDGSELFITHVALMNAYADQKNYEGALRHARWLARHRGRAYTEANSDWVARPFNVAQSNLALLRVAEFSLATGDKSNAADALKEFRGNWSAATKKGFLSERIKQIEAQL